MVILIIGLVIALGVVAVWAASEHVRRVGEEALRDPPMHHVEKTAWLQALAESKGSPVVLPPVDPAVAIIDAMGTAMAKVWNPQPPQQLDIPVDESSPDDANEYDPFLEHEKQMMAEWMGTVAPEPPNE